MQGFDHELEAQLHEARVLSVRPFDAERVHVSMSYELVLDSGHLCIFKPADGLLEAVADGLYHGKQALARYDHTPVSTTISECAAWQLAKQLGSPCSELVVPTVMKFPQHPEAHAPMVGAASVFRGGDVGKRGFYDAVPDQVSSAAFFKERRFIGDVRALTFQPRDSLYHLFVAVRSPRSRLRSGLVRTKSRVRGEGAASGQGQEDAATRGVGETRHTGSVAAVSPREGRAAIGHPHALDHL